MLIKYKIKKIFPKNLLNIILDILSSNGSNNLSITIFSQNKEMIFSHNQIFSFEKFDFLFQDVEIKRVNNWLISKINLEISEHLHLATHNKELLKDKEHAVKSHNLLKNLIKNLILAEIEKKQLMSETLDRYQEINALYNMSEEIMHKFELDSLIKTILNESIKAVKSKDALLFLLDEKQTMKKSWETFGMPVVNISEKFNKKLNECLAGNKIEIIEDLQNNDLIIENEYNYNSAVIVPLKSKEKEIGVLTVFDKIKKEGFSSSDMKVLHAIGT